MGSFERVQLFTSEFWPVKDVRMYVFYQTKTPDRFFIAAATVGSALGVAGESLRSTGKVPDHFTLDNRIKKIVWNTDLFDCIRGVLSEKEFANADVQDMVEEVEDAVKRHQNKDETPKKKRERREEEEEDDEEDDVEMGNVAYLNMAHFKPLEDRIVQRVTDNVKQLLSFEAIRAAEVMVYNSKEFQDRKKALMDAKLKEMAQSADAQIKAAVDAKRQEMIEAARRNLEPVIKQQVENELREEVRRTSLPRMQEEQVKLATQQLVASSAVPGPLFTDTDLFQALSHNK